MVRLRQLPGEIVQIGAQTFANGGFSLQYYLPWLIITNGDTVSHTFTFTLKVEGGAQDITVPFTLVPAETGEFPVQSFASVAIDTASSSVTAFYSRDPVTSSSGVQIQSYGGEFVFTDLQNVAKGTSRTVYAPAAGFKAIITQYAAFGPGTPFNLHVQSSAGTIMEYVAKPGTATNGGGTGWKAGHSSAADTVIYEGDYFYPGDILQVTNEDLVNAIAYSVRILVTPL